MAVEWRTWLRRAAIPSTAFAAVVFAFGWMEVSPFASWPLGLIILVCAPALGPFVLATNDLARQQRQRRFDSFLTPQSQVVRPRLRDMLTRRQLVFLGALGALVFVSFFMAFADYQGSPKRVDGELVFTDHGEIVGPATERQADEARTRETRMFAGHLMWFGVIGLLARVQPETLPPPATRPVRRTRRP